LSSELWPRGCSCTAELRIDHLGAPPATIRARDDPAGRIDTEELARRAGAVRRARTPGYRELSLASAEVLGAGQGLERRFTTHSSGRTVPMFEQYLVSAGRAFAVAAPESARLVADRLRVIAASPSSPQRFESRFLVEPGADWALREQVMLRRNGTAHVVTLARAFLHDGTEPWRESERAALMTLPDAALVGQVETVVLDNLRGELLTVRWRRDGVAVLTKLGLTTAAGAGIAMRIDLPHVEQAAFPALARHALLVE
jgi:hypothetical protein